MTRNKAFLSSRPEPFSEHDGVFLDHGSVRGALRFFNPTQARFGVDQLAKRQPEVVEEKPPERRQVVAPRVMLQWRSRNNRKGRHAISVDRKHPATTASVGAVLRGIARMFIEWPYWDVSYLVAVSFAIGSLIFIASGLFSWLPIVAPSSEFPNESTVAGGATSFVGAMLFEFGAVLLVFEAYNENRTGCFGWALHQALFGDGGQATNGDVEQGGAIIAKVDPDNCQHHHRRAASRKQRRAQAQKPGQHWRWYPSWHEIKTHYIHEIGFVANMTLSIGATLFCVTGICSIPGIYSNMSRAVAWGTYWLAYLIGGVLFMIASLLIMLETQPTWYTPAPHLLGWHIGLWNLVGSVGWTLAASLGYCTSSGCEYEGGLTLIWASAAFFIGSMLQWYEALEKYPIDKKM